MKKVLLAAVMLFSISSFATVTTSTPAASTTIVSDDGRHIPASEVPAAVLASFNKHFPKATNVRWEIDREHGSRVYEAKFRQNGQCKQAEFTPGGALLEVKNRDCNSDSSGDN